jgi:NAD(P)-dependent dehydrogenase (short-subunit alcohol dehydrogenase family)
MGARNQEKAKAAIERLVAEGVASGQVHHLNLDLSDPKLAKQAAEEFLAKESRLDVLGIYRPITVCCQHCSLRSSSQ